MRLFGSDRLAPLMEAPRHDRGEVISRRWSRADRQRQRRVETHNFDIRKQLLDYDNVMNKQREVIYRLRNEILDTEKFSDQIKMMIEEDLDEKLNAVAPPDSYPEIWDIPSLKTYLERAFGFDWDATPEEIAKLDCASLRETLLTAVRERYAKRGQEFEGYDFHEIERMILLQMIDKAWKGHLYDLDHLKKSIGLRAYGQKDPKVEYQKESFIMFEAMLARIRGQSVEYLFKVEAPRIPPPPPIPQMPLPEESAPARPAAAKPNGKGSLLRKAAAEPAAVPSDQKIGRNDCFCGSGKKYKCHGPNAGALAWSRGSAALCLPRGFCPLAWIRLAPLFMPCQAALRQSFGLGWLGFAFQGTAHWIFDCRCRVPRPTLRFSCK